ncbi:uncharacterized protein TM35_000061560 [Trypanosoma theileri]|uniref:Uncharacterized protein n=1 Tax=Trypanosoma theileri TaxID=67003 RepID=A0A1X0P2R7_9TRYP|nr:uncharacterized protein TM35_000061560 [Trypanosoma theileri]ORC91151.1 hypothetical protein TM35_000061560 [Trypanosoma theileri]
MTSEDHKYENSDKRGVSWISSIGGISPSEYLSSVNTSLETVVSRIEAGFLIDTLEVDVRELCIDINRLVDHIKLSGMYCSAETYSNLLTTLERLRTAVAQMRRCKGEMRMTASTSFYTYKIRTPPLPSDLQL